MFLTCLQPRAALRFILRAFAFALASATFDPLLAPAKDNDPLFTPEPDAVVDPHIPRASIPSAAAFERSKQAWFSEYMHKGFLQHSSMFPEYEAHPRRRGPLFPNVASWGGRALLCD